MTVSLGLLFSTLPAAQGASVFGCAKPRATFKVLDQAIADGEGIYTKKGWDKIFLWYKVRLINPKCFKAAEIAELKKDIKETNQKCSIPVDAETKELLLSEDELGLGEMARAVKNLVEWNCNTFKKLRRYG